MCESLPPPPPPPFPTLPSNLQSQSQKTGGDGNMINELMKDVLFLIQFSNLFKQLLL